MTLSPFRQSLTSALNIDGQERFDLAFLRRLLQAIDVRLKPLQEQQASVEQTLVGLQGITLDRINDILTPAIEDVFTLTERGFLIATSSTEAVLEVGNILEFEVSDAVERRLFTPSPFTALTRSSTADDYAVARSIAYDSISGIYRCEVEAVVGAAGPHSDWVIGALAGSTVAQYALLAEGQSVRDVILAAVSTGLGHRNEAAGSATAAGIARGGAESARDAAAGSAGAAADAAVAAGGFAAAAAVFDPDNFASSDQGDKADTAVQPGSLGTAAAKSEGFFAPASHNHGVAAITGLQDLLDGLDSFPALANNAGKSLIVNSEETGAEWGGASSVVLEVITLSMTFDLEDDDLGYYVMAFGAGGGAKGGGMDQRSNYFGENGPAGAGGALAGGYFPRALINGPVDILVGAGGVGGAGRTSGWRPNVGGDGGDSQFGFYLLAEGGAGSSIPNQDNAAGGRPWGLAGQLLDEGASITAGPNTDRVADSIRGGAGGGSGRNVNSRATGQGGLSKFWNDGTGRGVAGSSGNLDGGDGAPFCGGGGGLQPSLSEASGNGGNGGMAAGGGGGAGGTNDGAYGPTGSGGSGGDGVVFVWRFKG